MSAEQITDAANESPRVDWFIFTTGSILLLAVVLPIVLAPQASDALISNVHGWITEELGIWYVNIALLTTGFLTWLAVSENGSTVLGPPGIEPEHSRFAWISMLFCTGIGAAVIYWGATEWTYYFQAPPFSVEPRSDEAILWASSYGIFHWGPIAWALYCLPTIAFCVSYHYRGEPTLRLSAACAGVLGDQAEKWPGRVIDLFFIVGLLGTASTGLAFGVELVTSAMSELMNWRETKFLRLGVMGVVTMLIAYSVYRGLDKGIKVLSILNARLALAFIAFVFVAGPTLFILEMTTASLGHLAQNVIRMVTWTDPLERASFIENWTVFYWAWWIALGPFVGMFVAKVSRGRTIREVVFGMLGWGSLGCALFFLVLGNYALFLELEGLFGVIEHVNTNNPSSAIAVIIDRLPMGSVLLFYIAVVGIIFAATTYDSATYTLAAGSTRHMKANQHPVRAHRVYWAFALGMLPSVLLFIGGLRPLQTASIAASLPLLVIYLLLMVSIVRMLREPAVEA